MGILAIHKVSKKKKYYDEPELPEDIKSTMVWDDITESHFEHEWNISGMAPILSKYRLMNFKLYCAIRFIIFPPKGTTSA